jgi:hypothetical protein
MMCKMIANLDELAEMAYAGQIMVLAERPLTPIAG